MMLRFSFASSEVNRESNFRMFVRESASHLSSLIPEEQRVPQVMRSILSDSGDEIFRESAYTDFGTSTKNVKQKLGFL